MKVRVGVCFASWGSSWRDREREGRMRNERFLEFETAAPLMCVFAPSSSSFLVSATSLFLTCLTRLTGRAWHHQTRLRARQQPPAEMDSPRRCAPASAGDGTRRRLSHTRLSLIWVAPRALGPPDKDASRPRRVQKPLPWARAPTPLPFLPTSTRTPAHPRSNRRASKHTQRAHTRRHALALAHLSLSLVW